MNNQNTIFATILFALAFIALSPTARAVVPAPDGGYPGGNTAEGENALFSLTTGGYNTGNGSNSLYHLSSGSFNTGIGAATLFANTGDNNTATGAAALFSNTTGTQNTAAGVGALLSNTTGNYNTATGLGALHLNATGSNNTAHGINALYYNTGDYNTAVGANALISNTTGVSNTATGGEALYRNTTGVWNTANGIGALRANTTGIKNTAFGKGAGSDLTTGDYNVCIGAEVYGVAGESNTTRIRNIYASVANGRAVYVNSDHKIGTLASSRRFKEEIKTMDHASEVLYALKPVSFRYKKEFDAGRSPMFGLIAEDVEQVDPDLVSRNEKGEAETVRYEQINAMLLNEFLKEHRKVEEQQTTIAQLRTEMQSVVAHLKEQDSKIQRVSDQVQLTKSAPQLAKANR